MMTIVPYNSGIEEQPIDTKIISIRDAISK